MSPRVLLICPAFYPYPAVASVRATNWARLLPARGWTPHVAPRSPGRQLDPDAFAREVHPDVVLHPLAPHADGLAAKAGPPTLKQRAKGLLPPQVFVPDPSIVFWRKRAPMLRSLVREVAPDVIVTTGPPHSIHAAGLTLRRETGVPWLADFRDPHLMDDRFLPRGPLAPLAKLHLRFEAQVYAHADAVTHAIEMHQRWARLRYPAARDRCHFLPHFCPPDLASGSITPEASPQGVPSIRAVGHLGDEQAVAIAQAILTLRHEDGVDAELRHAGREPESGGEVRDLLGERAAFEGRVSHDRARALVAGADVLVAALAPQRSGTIGVSSKLYEYIAARRPLIVINPTRPDRRLLRGVPYARVLDRPTPQALVQALRESLADRAKGDPPEAEGVIARYSMQRHADTLAGLLDRIAASPNDSRPLPTDQERSPT